MLNLIDSICQNLFILRIYFNFLLINYHYPDKILIVQWKKERNELRIGARNKKERKNRGADNVILI